ncbi:MAG: 2-oxoacid:acceptor oxidoreductase family protein [Spirochaetes bacterium]|nr:2-oxoacid:acceptor oxidoreductase family protein [Spirochaetota bacterium]
MHEEIILAGFGGQGILLLGKLLAEAAMEEGRNVSWLPSYGPEMRGGTANANVIISDDQIGSPIIIDSTIVVAMNRPSLEKFEKTLVKDGILFMNSSIIDIEPSRKDIKVYRVPANEIASNLGNLKIANMVMAGAIIEKTKLVNLDVFINVIKENFAGKKSNLLEINIKAIEEGMRSVKNQ